jgi:hypothetical protein
MRPDAGVFIADMICMRQVYYGITDELKGEIESMNGQESVKCPINRMVLLDQR